MLQRLRYLSLPTQLAAGSMIAVIIIFIILVSAIDMLFKGQLNDIVTDHQQTEAKLLAHELHTQYEDEVRSLKRVAKYVNSELAQDNAQLNTIQNSIDADILLLEQQGNGFQVVNATSANFTGMITKKNGQDTYTGKWHTPGQDYLIHYQPISGLPGRYFALLMPYDSILQEMRNNLNALQIGKRGYVYVTDAAEDKGTILIHPSESVLNKNVFDLFPTAKSAFASMYDQTSGVTNYTIQVAGQDKAAEESKVIFHHVEGWDWVVAIKTYQSEYKEELMHILLFVIGICCVAAVALSTTLWIHIKNSLNPLRDITKGVREIGEGNLAYRFKQDVSKSSQNETHMLQISVQNMRNGLIELIEEVQSSSDQLLETARIISSSNDRLIHSATNSSNTCAQVASAIEQVSASIEEVAHNSTEVSEETVSVNTTTEEGYLATQQVEKTIASLSTSFEHASTTIKDVESSTENIGNVVNVINEIAEQTNLLALNAAIEAARAGEQGRGFAVVADEVRVLAQRTQQSTEEIKQVVEGLQKGSRSAVSTMQEGRDQVENSVQQAINASAILARINKSMDIVAQGISSVAASTEEQSVAATQIRGNAEELHAAASSTFEEAQNSQEQSQRINTLAERLKKDLTRFKL